MLRAKTMSHSLYSVMRRSELVDNVLALATSSYSDRTTRLMSTIDRMDYDGFGALIIQMPLFCFNALSLENENIIIRICRLQWLKGLKVALSALRKLSVQYPSSNIASEALNHNVGNNALSPLLMTASHTPHDMAVKILSFKCVDVNYYTIVT